MGRLLLLEHAHHLTHASLKAGGLVVVEGLEEAGLLHHRLALHGLLAGRLRGGREGEGGSEGGEGRREGEGGKSSL